MKQQELLNLPDLAFVRYCEKTYHINKGVYNTIEHWFYVHDLSTIVERRKIILLFLEKNCHSSKKIQFGAGGLKVRLEKFSEDYAILAEAN